MTLLLCKTDGNVKKDCFKLIGYPDWWKRKIKPQHQSRQPFVNIVQGKFKSTSNMMDSPLETILETQGANIEYMTVILDSIQ